jgi:excisionase family DNA binding protein
VSAILLDLAELAKLPAKIASLEAENAAFRARFDRLEAQRPDSAADLITVIEAARLRGCCIKTVRRQIDAGKIPCVRKGRSVLVRRADVVAA